jgi:hypothetical protein
MDPGIILVPESGCAKLNALLTDEHARPIHQPHPILRLETEGAFLVFARYRIGLYGVTGSQSEAATDRVL